MKYEIHICGILMGPEYSYDNIMDAKRQLVILKRYLQLAKDLAIHTDIQIDDLHIVEVKLKSLKLV